MATKALAAVQIADSKIELREFGLLEKMHPHTLPLDQSDEAGRASSRYAEDWYDYREDGRPGHLRMARPEGASDRVGGPSRGNGCG